MHRHSFKLVKAAGPMRSDSQSSSAKHRLSRDGLWKNLLLGRRASCSIGRQGWEYCSCLHGPKAKSGASRSGVEKKKERKTGRPGKKDAAMESYKGLFDPKGRRQSVEQQKKVLDVGSKCGTHASCAPSVSPHHFVYSYRARVHLPAPLLLLSVPRPWRKPIISHP